MVQKEKLDILLVDDKQENLPALESMLKTPDLNIVKTTSGNDARGLVLEYDFVLVLIDAQMRDMKALETAEFIRGIENTKNIPIIFMIEINKEQKYVSDHGPTRPSWGPGSHEPT